jgi:hypothetical protein
MPGKRDLYHGTNGDNILKIIQEGMIRPNSEQQIFFSENSPQSVLMHGGDTKRKKTFAVKARVEIPGGASYQRRTTMGVQDTFVVTTPVPLSVEILELYFREPHGTQLHTVSGTTAIRALLK